MIRREERHGEDSVLIRMSEPKTSAITASSARSKPACISLVVLFSLLLTGCLGVVNRIEASGCGVYR